jgi:hypothetical protein
MKRLLVLTLLPLACVGQPRPPAVHSPEVHADRTVTFRLQAPKATEVRLTGDLVKAPQAFERDAGDAKASGPSPSDPCGPTFTAIDSRSMV